MGREIQGSRTPSRHLVVATALSFPLESQSAEQQGWEERVEGRKGWG